VDITSIPKKSDELEISWKKTCEKTTTEMGKNRKDFSLLRGLTWDSDTWREL